jgi:hypothetical protein
MPPPPSRCSPEHRRSVAIESPLPVKRHLHHRLPRELDRATFLAPVRLATHHHASALSCQSAAGAVTCVPHLGAARSLATMQHQPAWLQAWQQCGREPHALCIQATPGTTQPGCAQSCASRPSRFGGFRSFAIF